MFISIASKPLQASELHALLTQSRPDHTALGVAGMLVYRAGKILPLIEGEQAVITDLYSTIAKDSRHQSIEKIWDAPLKARSFSGWSMAVVSDHPLALAPAEGYALLSAQELFAHGSDATGKKLLLGLHDHLLRSH